MAFFPAMSVTNTGARAPASRPPGRPSGPKHSRRMQIAVVALSVGLLGVAGLIFLLQRGDGGGGASRPAKKSVSANVQLVLGEVQNANTGSPATLPDDAANQIMQAVGTYVDQGLVVPVKTGKPAKDLSSLFDAGTAAAVAGPDKDVLFESGQPERTGDFKPAAQPVVINALSDDGGQFVLATATFNYSADVVVAGGTLTTTRSTALTFVPDGGQWKITGYDVLVSRQGAQVEGAPTAAASQP